MALVTVTSLTGCTGSDAASDGPQPTSSAATPSTSDPTDVPQTDGIDQIDLDGADGSPITWQLPDGVGPTDPVGVAQRYIAIIQQAGIEGADLDPSVVDSIASKDVQMLATSNRPAPRHRPSSVPRRGTPSSSGSTTPTDPLPGR
jgi:hypothetical protein